MLRYGMIGTSVFSALLESAELFAQVVLNDLHFHQQYRIVPYPVRLSM